MMELSNKSEYEKIIPIKVSISKSLYDEIIYAQIYLNNIEKNKKGGMKKKIWNILETSHKISNYLKAKRLERKP